MFWQNDDAWEGWLAADQKGNATANRVPSAEPRACVDKIIPPHWGGADCWGQAPDCVALPCSGLAL